ncbi:hypothetical protein T439DRAFT_326285 [Meredithblackwellia eburnea MCA 4105]
MAQGFKLKAPAKAKSSQTRKKLQPKDLKKGARTIAPKKDAAVARAMVHKKNTSSHSSSLEKVIATQAVAHGKLTIMRSQADESEEGKAAARAKK